MSYLLGIDAGTSALKVILYDQQGHAVAEGSQEYHLATAATGTVECDPEAYWSALQSVVSQVLSAAPPQAREVQALAISSQAETFVLIDQQGNPLRNAIVWLDSRAGAEALEIRAAFGPDTVYRKSGCPEVDSTWAATKLLWLRKHEPQVFERIYKVLLVEDYLIYRLTGCFAVNGALCCSTLLYDINTDTWWPEMLDYVGIGPDQLPELYPSGVQIAEMRPDVAADLGFSGRPVVVSGGMDQACSCIGSGNITSGVLTENTGTSLNVSVTTDVPVFDPQRRVPCQTHALAGKYIFLPWCSSGGILLRWFRDQLSEAQVEQAALEHQDVYALLTESAASVPPGSEGLVILPHLSGAMSPEMDPNARAVIYGIHMATQRQHIVKAIMESVAYLTRSNVDLVAEAGIGIEQIILTGGTAHSRLWNQIKADVLGRKVKTIKNKESGCLGAAILAGLALGVYHSVQEACATLIEDDQVYQPTAQHHQVYQKCYDSYRRLYDALKPMFAHTASM